MTDTPQTAKPLHHRMIVTGSRDWTSQAVIAAAIADHIALKPDAPGVGPSADWEAHTVVHGAARGADTIAARLAVAWWMQAEPHPADWETHGRAAGPIRNQHMVDLGADVCLTFASTTSSKGTFDCARKARAAGIPTFDYGVDTRAEEPT